MKLTLATEDQVREISIEARKWVESTNGFWRGHDVITGLAEYIANTKYNLTLYKIREHVVI